MLGVVGYKLWKKNDACQLPLSYYLGKQKGSTALKRNPGSAALWNMEKRSVEE